MAVLDTGELRLHFTDSGVPGGGHPTPLLLVHGWGCDGEDWAVHRRALAGRHRVIVPELPGHGRSSTPPPHHDPDQDGYGDRYAPRRLAADLAVLLRLLGCGPVIAVGHSMGGHVVSALAVEHPELVDGVATVATGFGGETAAGRRLAEEQAALRREGAAWAVRFVNQALGPTAPTSVQARHQRLMADMDPQVLAACRYGTYLAPDAFGLRPAAERYLRGRRCPVLALHTSPAAAQWERALPAAPGSRVELWSGAGHFVHEERPAQLVALLREWAGQLRPGQGGAAR